MRDYEPFWDVVLIAAETDAELVRSFTSRPMRVSEHAPWSRVRLPDRRLDDNIQSVVWENEMFVAVIDVIELGALMSWIQTAAWECPQDVQLLCRENGQIVEGHTYFGLWMLHDGRLHEQAPSSDLPPTSSGATPNPR